MEIAELKATLQSSDGILFEVNSHIIGKCNALKNIYQDHPPYHHIYNDPLPLPLLDAESLSKAIEWCEFHTGSGMGTEYNNELSVEEVKFFGPLSENLLHKLLMASDFLEIPELLSKTNHYICHIKEYRSKEAQKVCQPNREILKRRRHDDAGLDPNSFHFTMNVKRQKL